MAAWKQPDQPVGTDTKARVALAAVVVVSVGVLFGLIAVHNHQVQQRTVATDQAYAIYLRNGTTRGLDAGGLLAGVCRARDTGRQLARDQGRADGDRAGYDTAVEAVQRMTGMAGDRADAQRIVDTVAAYNACN
jgi:hypothetical protein